MKRTIFFLTSFTFLCALQSSAQVAKVLIEPNTVIRANESKGDCNGEYGCFIMQGDGNFVFYLKGKAKWATGTQGTGVNVAIMQGDGNFVLYKEGSQAVWSSRSAGNPGMELAYYHRANFWGTHKHGIALWSGRGPLEGPSRFWEEDL